MLMTYQPDRALWHQNGAGKGLPRFAQDIDAALVALYDGAGAVLGGSISGNHIAPTTMYSDAPGVLGLVSGSAAAPDESDRPVLWLSKHTKLDTGSDTFAHNVGNLLSETLVYGAGPGLVTNGTWISQLGNTVLQGVNRGTEGAPVYDLAGNAIGLAGFARSEKPNEGIVTGLWGYASTPSMTDTEFDAYSLPFAVAGQEINIDIRHKDPGAKSNVSGKGTTIGEYIFNYQSGTTVRDWSFGVAYNGRNRTGDVTDTNVDNWNGFYVGILLDKIKAQGILFGPYFKDGSYGIRFPDSYAGSQAPAAAIHLGNSKFQLGQYTGSTFVDNDLWQNGGRIFYRRSGVSQRLLTDNAGVTLLSAVHTFSLNGGFALRMSAAVNAVNYLAIDNAAAGGSPVLSVVGADTDLDMVLTPKGAGLVRFGTYSALGAEALAGYMLVKDAGGTTRKVGIVA